MKQSATKARLGPIGGMTRAPTSNTFAEFFSGVGLVRLALERAGWQCAFANDINEKKAEIYRQNFGHDDLRVCDVRDLGREDIPHVALATASFPCTDLSLAGNRAGLEGSESGTFWPFVDLLRALADADRAPTSVLIENVPGFLTSNDGKDFRSAVAALNKLGYACDAVVLDAVHFVPQSRARLFVIASSDPEVLRPLRSLESESDMRPPKLDKFIQDHADLQWGRVDFPLPPHRDTHLADVIEALPDDHPAWWSKSRVAHLIETMRPLDRDRAEHVKNARRPTFGTVYRRTRNGVAVAELRVDGVAGCLRTARGGSSKQFLLVGGSGKLRARNLSPREYARLQGVPDTFRIDVPDNQALFGFGDAVCVPAVQWLISHAFPIQIGHRKIA